MIELEFIPISTPYWTEILNLILNEHLQMLQGIGQLMIPQRSGVDHSYSFQARIGWSWS